MPDSENEAVVSTALELPNVTSPGPDSLVQSVVSTALVGLPSSVTVPSRTALLGRTIDWFVPASTAGGLFDITLTTRSS